MQVRRVAAVITLSLMALIWGGGMCASPAMAKTDLLPGSELLKFVRTVIDKHPRVAAAQAHITASEAIQRAADHRVYNPSLTLGAESAIHNTLTMGLSQTLDWSGKREARVALATADVKLSEAHYLLQRRGLTIGLLLALADYQTNIEHSALALERLTLMRKFVDLAKEGVELGNVSSAELNLTTLVYTDARLRQATAAAGLIEARQKVSMFAYSSTYKQWPLLDAGLPVLPAKDDVASLLQALPEVQISQRRVALALAGVQMHKAEQALDPSVGVVAGKEGGRGLIGVHVSIPLPMDQGFSHVLTAAQARHHQAQFLADDALQRARVRLISAREGYQVAQRAMSEWQRIGHASVLKQGGQLYNLWVMGELNTTDFLMQLDQTLNSQDSALDLRKALWRAWFEYLAASGGIERWLDTGGRDGLKNNGYKSPVLIKPQPLLASPASSKKTL